MKLQTAWQTRIALCLVTALSTVATGWTQIENDSNTMPPLAPDFRTPGKMENRGGHPELPARPPLIPVARSDEQLTQTDGLPVRRSLSWRSRAHKLKQSTTATQKILRCNYDNALMNLLSSLSQANLQVDTLHSKAGELLAVSTDNAFQQKIIFVLAEMPPGTVTIKAAPFSPNKNALSAISSVFQALDQPKSREALSE